MYRNAISYKWSKSKRKMNSKEEYLIDSVSCWLAEQGFEAQGKQAGGDFAPLRPDLIAKGPSGSLVIESKVAYAYRSKVFPALVGDAILRAQHAKPKPNLLLAFLLDKLNDKAVSDVERYAEDFYPELNWFLMDESGSGMVKLSGLRQDISREPYIRKADIRSSPYSTRGSLFSPSNRRLLKMLLLPGIDPRYWGGPSKVPDAIVKLAKACNLSQPKASAFVKRFEEAGFLRRSDGKLKIIRHEELLEEWYFGIKQERRILQPVRSMYGDSLERIMEKVKSRHALHNKPDVVVGSHYACHAHDIGRSSVKSAILYVSRASIMEYLDLVADESGSASLWLASSDFEAIRQGTVIADGLPVCDILQCYLDVRGSRARGQEQADYIAQHILLPHFRSMP